MTAGGKDDDLFFLPISEGSTRELLESAALLDTLSVPELAAVLLIQNLPTLALSSLTAPAIEAAYAKTLEAGREVGSRELFAKALSARYSQEDFASGLAMLDGLDFRLLDEEVVVEQTYLTAAGGWDFQFRLEHAARLNPIKITVKIQPERFVRLTDSQFRMFNLLRSEIDDHLHLQGFAGVGKTAFVGILVESLSQHRVLVLAQTTQQLQVLTGRIGKGFTGMTFGQLASRLLFTPPTAYRRPERQRYQPGYQVSDAQIATWLQFREVAGFSPTHVAGLCRRAVQSFCYSDLPCISEQNIPTTNRMLLPADYAVLLEYANLFWRETTQPQLKHARLPLRVYHLLKMLALDEIVQLSAATYTHVIIDEAHDLPIPLLQFLDRSPQTTLTLGDICQRLDGLPVRRGAHVRERQVNQSVRAGRQIEEVLNPLIEAIPYASLEPFAGAKDRKTTIEYYDRSSIPEDGTTILVKSEWGLFEWFQRLAAANADFGMMPGAESQFRRFVNDCIELYHHGSPPKHGALFRHQTWSQLTDKHGKEYSFSKIHALLEKGYSSMDFERSLAVLNRGSQPRILLGRVADARSMEMDRVMLGKDLLSSVRAGDQASAGEVFSTIYTGGSRARHKLIVPGHLRDWISDQNVKIKTV